MKNMYKIIALMFVVSLSLMGCHKEMKTVAEMKNDIDLSKIVSTDETKINIVDTKTNKIENDTEVETTKMDLVLKDSEKESELEETIDSAKLVNGSESLEENGEKIASIIKYELKEEVEEDCIERHFTIEEALQQEDMFKYGKSPCKWVYIAPNKQIISNYKPKSSEQFSINKKATSRSKGCFLPILSGTNNANDDYEARFLCFDDTKRDIVNEFRFTNKIKDIEYRGIPIGTILEKGGFKLEEMSNGILKVVDSGYINVIYVDDLDKILGIKD